MSTTAAIQRKLAELTRRTGRRTGSRAAAWDTARDGQVIGDASAKLGYLLETEVFRPLSGPERTWLVESTTMISCERGRVFYTPDEPGEVVFILKRGRVDLEMGLLGQGMYGCYAEATEDSLICVLSRADLQALIRRNPEVGLRLLAELGSRLREREEGLEALAFRGLPARLAALLLREADVYGTVDGYSHQELAERLGTYRETVSQLLGRFRSEGLVAVEPRRIRVLDRAGLEAYAEV
jgi:CRP/FNR family cyclic AMP-dependent transcriptional regulator